MLFSINIFYILTSGIIYTLPLFFLSTLYFYFRGNAREKTIAKIFNHSFIFSPINMFMTVFSKVSITPFISMNEFPELSVLKDNWKIFAEDAKRLLELQKIKRSVNHDDIGFDSFFKYGWKRFYLKWYSKEHKTAISLCPKSCEILKKVSCVKAAVFAELPPGSKLNPHRDPYAGSVRYHLGLITPNDDNCYINIDGIKYSWRDGEDILFDETYLHEAYNNTNKTRVILFVDVERPMKYKFAEIINNLFGYFILKAAYSPNDKSDHMGILAYIHSKVSLLHHDDTK